MNAEELRNLTESYYYDVYGGEEIDEANKMEKEMGLGTEARIRTRNFANNPRLAKNPQLTDKTDPIVNRFHKKARAKRLEKHNVKNESYDLYDVVLDYLLSEGICESVGNAENIMANMSDAWISAILDEAQEVLSVKSPTGQQRMKNPRIRPSGRITLSPEEREKSIQNYHKWRKEWRKRQAEIRRLESGQEDDDDGAYEERERAKERAFDRQIHQRTRPANRETHLAHVRRKARARKGMDESYDLYDIVLDYLLSEGICETVHNAENIMANMSDAWISAILDEAASYEPTGRATRRPRQKGKKPEIPADIMARAQERAQQHQEYRTKHGITGLDVSPDAERIARTMMARKRAKETPQERLAKVQIRQ